MTIRGLIVSIVMTIVLCIMTLGYAALQQRIDIQGEATVDSTYRVEITRVSEGTTTGDARSTNAPQYNGLTANFYVGLTNDTDYITYTVEITNYSTVDIILNNTEITSTNNNMKTTKSGIRNGDIMLAGSTKTATIKIKLDTETSSEQTGTITVTFDFTRLKGGTGSVVKEGLPTGYTELEYIESTGTQYIDTGYAQKNAPKIVTDMAIVDRNDTDLFGNSQAASDSFIVDTSAYQSMLYYRYGASSYTRVYISDFRQFDTHEFSDKVIINNNTIYTKTDSYDFSNNSQTINIFRGRNFGSLKLKYLKLYDGDNLVRDFIPSYLKSTDEIGLYDLVENKFYKNDGAGVFLKGTDVESNILPNSYQQVEYIESTGTQYINTGYAQKVKPKIITDMIITSPGDFDIFGNVSTANDCYIVDSYVNQGTSSFYYRYGASSYTLVSISNNKFQYTPTFMNYTFGSSVYINGKLVHNVTNQYDFSNNTKNIYLFRGRTYAGIRIKNLQLYDGEELVRDYIPALDNNNVPCLYDTVSGDTFYNQGTGNFLYQLKQ